MPRGDRTGPLGMGPMTGRAAGYCAGTGFPGYANPGGGRGRGFGGGGFGFRRRFFATGIPGRHWFGGIAEPYGFPGTIEEPDAATEKRALKQQAESLQSQMDCINKRLAALETGTSEE